MVFVQFCLKHSRLHQGQEGKSVLNLGPTASPPYGMPHQSEDVLLDLLQPTDQNPGVASATTNFSLVAFIFALDRWCPTPYARMTT